MIKAADNKSGAKMGNHTNTVPTIARILVRTLEPGFILHITFEAQKIERLFAPFENNTQPIPTRRATIIEKMRNSVAFLVSPKYFST
jgi:hypothetical protein